ncbi:NAD-dependent protein deacylase [Aestuariibacter halophilus]|uniref:NAD-dependent protein deacylase n=1 Tax=Fluctibacter halophilus TaxID=226011 RepID=A0ABS8G547_9ALTE|nr:Sir2 family NAD+-dependent deacetylase [Aestuariibacter halophilus]MCC2615719.1 NAD-dependent protein deacylase [Aestuariibacter halophilus]
MMRRMRNIVILTGAGISAESGLKTFRDNDGLWEQHAIEDVATPQAFARDPALVYRFYNARRAQLQQQAVKPNLAHHAVARLQKEWRQGTVTLVTQNVDDLHERAGCSNVLHMHGELLSQRCCRSNQAVYCKEPFDATSRCQCCDPPSPVRPDIVWFGEMPMHMDRIEKALYNADVFVAIGTSGQVYPAAGFVAMASQCGAHAVELNLKASDTNTLFDEHDYGPATVVVPRFVERMLKEN